jgi:alkaline phosphatase D
MMLDFFDEPADSPRRMRAGVYHSVVIGDAPTRVQIVLLDTRYFRSPLVPVAFARGRYVADERPQATVLGEEQWTWLAEQLAQPAELRLVVSSIQVLADEHPFETWGLFPHDRARLLALLGDTDGVIVLSGDRHRGELSRASVPPLRYPLFDLTSSSLNLPIVGSEPNRFRIGAVAEQSNFGAIDIDWSRERIALGLYDERGVDVVTHEIGFADLMA